MPAACSNYGALAAAVAPTQTRPAWHRYHQRAPVPMPQSQQQQQQRRQVIAGLLGLVATTGLPFAAAAAAAADVAAPDLAATSAPVLGAAAPKAGSLAARIATEGSIQQPGIMLPWSPKQTYYPRWLFGDWEVEMEFTGLQLPLGRSFVPDGFLQAAEVPAEEGGLGSQYRFRQRWYSTLPDTLDNNLRVNLGLVPHDAIIADKAYNTRASTDAFLGYKAVESVEYDPRNAPLRQTVTLSRLAPDATPLPPRRLELYLNNLQSEAGDNGATFFTSELCRQVLLGVRQVEVTDYELMRSYRQLSPSRVEGRQRSCLYLQPQEQRFFEAGGRAVAVYDYIFSMRRLPPEADAPPAAVACVETPKQVFQCV